MGCQCNKKNEEEELNKEPENRDKGDENEDLENAGNLQNQEGDDINKIRTLIIKMNKKMKIT